MKRHTLFSVVSFTGMLAFAIINWADAATVSFFGSVATTEVNNWRDSSVSKSFDIDNSNVYGDSLGAVNWTHASAGQVGPGSFGWDYVGASSGGQFSSPGYASVNNLPNTANELAGIEAVQNPGSFTFVLNGVPADYAGKTVRVGVMADVLSAGEWAADTNKTFQLTGPGGGDSGVVSLRGGAAGDGQPEMYFFNLSGINPGDQFTITTANTGGSGQAGYIGPVSWDIATVPEPSSLALLVLGFAGLTRVVRRRK